MRLVDVVGKSVAGPGAHDEQQPDDRSAFSAAVGTPHRSRHRHITADSPFGTMLYDSSGQAIYLFAAETTSRPVCYDPCAAAWPPVLTKDATGQVSPSLLGTTRRSDGRPQVTYAGHPLYFYAHEGKHEVLRHDVDEYRGTWLVVRPDDTPAPG